MDLHDDKGTDVEMKVLNGGNIVRLVLVDVDVQQRLRQVSDTQVENLLLMAEDTGITTPIHVRRVAGKHVLIDGAHRLEAARRLGQTDIAALVHECRADEARAMEASNNLGAARMSPLQTAVFAASWKRDFYAMHPERKPGVFKGNQHSGKVVEDIMSVTTSVAEAFGITDRHARRILSVGEGLSAEEAAQLEAVPARIGLGDLLSLAKLRDPADRSRVVTLLHEGKAKRMGEALGLLKASKAPVETPVKDKVETEFKALTAAWARASLPAKKRFCLEMAHELWEVKNKGEALPNWSKAVGK